jgi:hypothetical protein
MKPHEVKMKRAEKAYKNLDFLSSREARTHPVRIPGTGKEVKGKKY